VRVADRLDHEPTTSRLRDNVNTGASILQAVGAVAVMLQQNATLRMPLFAALSVGAIASAWPLLGRWVRKGLDRVSDRSAARRAYPRFKELVQEFGRFVDMGTNDTLHHIADRELSEPCRWKLLGHPGVPSVHFWHHAVQFISQRLERQPQTLAELRFTISEFHYLVSAYYNHCIAAVFEGMPPDWRAQLTERDIRLLNGFQQRHAQFVQQYEAFTRQFASSRPALKDAAHFLQRSDPLVTGRDAHGA
jgi:hypothetical protein